MHVTMIGNTWSHSSNTRHRINSRHKHLYPALSHQGGYRCASSTSPPPLSHTSAFHHKHGNPHISQIILCGRTKVTGTGFTAAISQLNHRPITKVQTVGSSFSSNCRPVIFRTVGRASSTYPACGLMKNIDLYPEWLDP